jgi:hypothetical protein
MQLYSQLTQTLAIIPEEKTLRGCLFIRRHYQRERLSTPV